MIDKKTVEYVAKLSRLEIAGDQTEYLAQQLTKIISYIDKLKTLDITNVKPMRGLHEKQTTLREDIVKPCTYQKDILANAPAREGDYFKIPKVIE